MEIIGPAIGALILWGVIIPWLGRIDKRRAAARSANGTPPISRSQRVRWFAMVIGVGLIVVVVAILASVASNPAPRP